MRVIGRMTKQMDLELSSLRMAKSSTSVSGKMICTMVKALRAGQTVLDSMGISHMERKMVSVPTSGQTRLSTRETG